MKEITKLLAVILVLCMAIALCACGKKSEEPAVTTTEAPAGTTEEPIPTTTVKPDDGKVTYTVTVQDENGNPIVGAVVQLCKDVNCNPNVTGADGVATYSLAEDTYKVSFVVMPTGYTHVGTETDYYFAEGSRDLVITLKAAG